ncbi:MAG: arsenate reductase ArsC [Clostridia bacterium]|nr:arsenate reductase ArsC [Clostridia bacterium]
MKKKVAFICIHNSCRSQMAEGYMKKFGSDVAEAYSAGTETYHEVKQKAVEAMKLDGIDISMQYPKLLADIPGKLDILITMGCGVTCPQVPCDYRADWGLEDPSGGPIEDFIKTRELIRERILGLIEDIKNDNLEYMKETGTIHLAL